MTNHQTTFDPTQQATSQADLHVHTMYSDRPSEWVLRRVGAPESFTDPMEVYNSCKARGMDFVTISDHNCINGALDIAHLPNTFISNEVTTYWPEDGCKLHVLTTGITPEQFEMIQDLRENIYDFLRYCRAEDIIVTCAHPLYQVNDRMTPWHVEQLILLFKRFEGINGSRDPRACDMANAIFAKLTPDIISRMADKHGIEPAFNEPHIKWLTAGSDDHGGEYIASAFTQTPKAETVEQFLQNIREGRHCKAGRAGTSLRLAHSFYRIAYSYYHTRVLGDGSASSSLLGELFRQLLGETAPKPPKRTVFTGVKDVARKVVRNAKIRRLNSADRALVEEMTQLFDSAEHLRNNDAEPGERDRISFDVASRIAHRLGYTFFERCTEALSEGRMAEALQSVASLGPVAMAITPYIAAFKTQHKDERFLQEVALHFEQAHHLLQRSGKRGWVTDTFTDVNGVAVTINTMARLAREKQKALQVLTCQAQTPDTDANIKNFRPVGEFTLPEYQFQKLAFPPFLDIMEHIEQEQFSELIISTPGPLGLASLLTGRLLNLRLSGIYHTDFPTYVSHMTGDPNLEQLTWRYMFWFFDQMDTIFVPSEFYRRRLLDYGFNADKLRLMPRGVDGSRFNPGFRQNHFWPDRFGFSSDLTFLYVGRVSKEKNIEAMLEAFRGVRLRGHDANLAVVGDGPLLAELKKRYKEPNIAFTGFLGGEDLSTAYASADAFIYPSTTDTFGNAVLEAQASGLPAIVTDQGGPCEIVSHDRTGLVVNADVPEAMEEAICKLCRSTDLRRSMARAALETARSRTWDQVFDRFWAREEYPAEAEPIHV